MVKYLICALWGHKPWRLVQKTVVPAVAMNNQLHAEGPGALAIWEAMLRASMGHTTITLTCDRCSTIRTIEH